MSDESKRRAAELFTRFLAIPHEDLEDAFELLCKQHPNEADELRGLYAMHRMFEDDLAVFKKGRKEKAESTYTEGARVGDTIGDFTLVSRIASGGQGEVWEAEQCSLSRRVALKLVLPDRINEKTLALFAREARAGGRLAHRGIVAVFGYGEDDGRHWIAQELVEGAWTLRDFIDEMRNEEELPENYYRAVAVFVAELADALGAAHEAGVIHRDVKPQNVLVTPDDHPKLTDFGLARITDETALSVSGDLAGTWHYMSPEQVKAKHSGLDHRTDVFSLGVVMYEMLSFQRPFDGDTTHQIAENIVNNDPPDLRKIKSRVPKDLVVICAKSLEKLREGRFPSMSEFAADLRRHLANEPIHAQPPTNFERVVKWVRRNPTKSVATVFATVAFTVISGLGINLAKANILAETKTDDLETANVSLEKRTNDLEAKTTELSNSNSELKTKTAEAVANATRADAKTTDVLRLSLSQDYEDLIVAADELWPPHPQRIGALTEWIEEATKLTGELPALERKQAELRATAIPQTEEERKAGRASHPDLGKLDPLRAEIAAKRAALAVRRGELEIELPKVNRSDHPSGVSALSDAAWELAALETDLSALEQRVSERQAWTFPAEEESETRARWWHNQISVLISELRSLSAKGTGLLVAAGVSEEHSWSVSRRLALAERLRDGFAEGGDFAVRWERDLVAIHEAYPGLTLPMQLGLVPIGPDPASKLWEFWEVQSGTEPLRDEEGKLVLEESSGLVFVLLPSGKFWMGAQSVDPEGRNYDKGAEPDESPVHEVKLSAFFLSKYEMTQGQWRGLTGWNRSFFGPNFWTAHWARGGEGGDLLQPVTDISWFDCHTMVARWGFRLPSEAQWEYGARGGTSSVYWSGSGLEDLQGVANIADQYAKANGAHSSWRIEDQLDDGYAMHAPVDALLPNGFGLHHVHGNVWEWCQDWFDWSFYSKSPALDPLSPYEHSPVRVSRGGCFNTVSSVARSAYRVSFTPSLAGNSLGLRPARDIVK
ncbi:MAG: formylglycine-generating enzyme required for sulfatase activity/serine/threonine protein kinase [Planctomycetota bacterium]|jgi:formylglycine-generating enzyme required for sulfatase activity/serine/threonine protein kinase